MNDWVTVRHAVAISGQITDFQTGQAIARARVSITDGPSAFNDWLANYAKQYGDRWEQIDERPDRTRTAGDGHFHFMDLPDGDYILEAKLPGSGSRYGTGQQGATVVRDAEGHITMAVVEIGLPPTTIKGEIRDQHNEKVLMAEVRVKGSGERVFSDAEGQYLLAGLEFGERTVLISAQGFQAESRLVTLSQAGTVQTLNVVLQR